MFRSATLKLTLWYLAIVMAISLAFSAVLYHFATDELARGLHRQSQRITKEFPVFDNDRFFIQNGDLTAGARHILLELAYFNLLVFVGAGFASYVLARRTLRPIEQAHEQQKRFTADVSHELRTPLTAIKMSSEVALLDPAASKQELRQALQSNIEEADKLDILINNLLRLTRLEADELQQSFRRLSADKLAAAAMAQVSASAAQRNIRLHSQVRPLLISGDQDSLIQLLIILLDNAIKYSPKGANVYLDSRRHDDHVELLVRDEGIGIAPDALQHVFDRFYRADSSRHKTAAGGFGLGLSIAKLIADLHQATITLSSRLGKGTTATLRLPAYHDRRPH